VATANPVTPDKFDLQAYILDAAPFHPYAKYDRDMDCIRVYVRDCSVYEKRMGDFVTLYYDNFPHPNQRPCVGLALKGVNATFKALGIPHRAVYPLTTLIDFWAKQIPDGKRNEFDRAIGTESPMRDVEIDVDLDHALAA